MLCFVFHFTSRALTPYLYYVSKYLIPSPPGSLYFHIFRAITSALRHQANLPRILRTHTVALSTTEGDSEDMYVCKYILSGFNQLHYFRQTMPWIGYLFRIPFSDRAPAALTNWWLQPPPSSAADEVFGGLNASKKTHTMFDNTLRSSNIT